MYSLLRELRNGFRLLARAPGLAIFAAVAIALGIGSTTTMFSISHGMLRDLPFQEPDRLVYVFRDQVPRNRFDIWLNTHEFQNWRDAQTTLEGLAGFVERNMDLAGAEGRPLRVEAAAVTANTFQTLRVQPALGRGFLPQDERPGAEPIVVLGHRLWRDRYGGDPAIAGRTVRVNGQQRTVVGVMPEGLQFPYRQALWIPLELDPSAEPSGNRQIRAFGRLRDDVQLDATRAEFAALARRLELAYPESYEGTGASVASYKEHIVEKRDALLMNIMVAVVASVLLVACANVANLLLARAAARNRDVAIRAALGASRNALITQHLAEAFAIAALGGALGIGLAQLGVTLVNRALADQLPFFWMWVEIDPTVLGFCFALILAATILAGLGPAIKATGVQMNEVLKDASRSSSLRLGRFSRTLVVAEVALSCGLLTVAGLMVKGVLIQTASELDFATEDVLTARAELRSEDYPDRLDIERFYGELLDRLESRPEVLSAAIVTRPPGVSNYVRPFQTEEQSQDRDRDLPWAAFAVISDDFFRALDVRLLAGRSFSTIDHAESEPVAIINQRFARLYFPGQDPLGRRLKLGGLDSESPWRTIVGVAPDLAMERRRERGSEGIYLPFSQSTRRTMSVLLRTAGDPLALVPTVRDEVAAIDPNLPIYQVDSLGRLINEDTMPERTVAVLFVVFGLAGLVLATVGLYGVMAFLVRRRTREIGIRMALGADAGRILWLTARNGLVQLVLGLAIGVALAALLAPAMREVLYDANPWDWRIYTLIALVLTATGVAASLAPALRAARVDPMETLRYE
ncbi:MAG: ABC transporter permease [Gemmatimonadota bacterium]|nr:MAG: ABC transporter permease [Gemmatimonadota bacterium]